jgi:hypothetical protein
MTGLDLLRTTGKASPHRREWIAAVTDVAVCSCAGDIHSRAWLIAIRTFTH